MLLLNKVLQLTHSLEIIYNLQNQFLRTSLFNNQVNVIFKKLMFADYVSEFIHILIKSNNKPNKFRPLLIIQMLGT